MYCEAVVRVKSYTVKLSYEWSCVLWSSHTSKSCKCRSRRPLVPIKLGFQWHRSVCYRKHDKNLVPVFQPNKVKSISSFLISLTFAHPYGCVMINRQSCSILTCNKKLDLCINYVRFENYYKFSNYCYKLHSNNAINKWAVLFPQATRDMGASDYQWYLILNGLVKVNQRYDKQESTRTRVKLYNWLTLTHF